MENHMRRQKIIPAAILAVVLATGTAHAQSTGESKDHEFACTAATVGGAVIGVGAGRLRGGGHGRTHFETAGGVAGGQAAHARDCPK
jgi:hypothetical protein